MKKIIVLVVFATNFIFAQNAGYCLLYPGIEDSYVTVPHHSSLSLTEFSIEAWVYLNEYPSSSYGSAPIVVKGDWDQSSSYMNYTVFVRSDGKVEAFYIRNHSFGYRREVISNSIVDLNSWFHIAVTRSNSGDLKIYINGTLEKTENSSDPPELTNEPVSIGGGDPNFYNGTNAFKGQIDDVRIWSDVRSESEIQNNKNSPNMDRNDPTLRGYWKFDEGSGTETGDYSSNFNNGTVATGITYIISTAPLPVELTTFTATSTSSATVLLNWTTATEVNNYGFEIERQILKQVQNDNNWQEIGFVNGHGNSNSPKDYSFIDTDISVADASTLLSNHVSYRLKQIDIDGSFEYSDVVTVELETPKEFKLSQNYPNPFNPTTMISYTLPTDSKVKVEIFNMLGQSVAVLVNAKKSAGYYESSWNAKDLPSGIYLINIRAEGLDSKSNFSQVKKALLLK